MLRLHRRCRRKVVFSPLFKLLVLFAALILTFSFCESRIPNLEASLVKDIAASGFEKASSDSVLSLSGELSAADVSNNISSIDSHELMSFKSQLVEDISNKINNSFTAWIPIGSFSHVRLLNGFGFKVPVRMCFSGSVDVSFSQQYESAGINQTVYTVYAEISSEMHPVSSAISEGYNFSSKYIIFQKNVIGTVPNISYGNYIG